MWAAFHEGFSTIDSGNRIFNIESLRTVRSIAALLVLALLLGLHWGVVQTIAWTRMVLEYSQSAPLGTAIAMTFDGQHPCALCLAVKKGRQQEHDRTPSTVQRSIKLECDLPFGAATLELPHLTVPPTPFHRQAEERSEGPPKPRPRDLATA